MNGKRIWISAAVLLAMIGVFVLAGCTASTWTPLPVKNDRNLFMPGSQPGQGGIMDTATRCDNCHGGYDSAVE